MFTQSLHFYYSYKCAAPIVSHVIEDRFLKIDCGSSIPRSLGSVTQYKYSTKRVRWRSLQDIPCFFYRRCHCCIRHLHAFHAQSSEVAGNKLQPTSLPGIMDEHYPFDNTLSHSFHPGTSRHDVSDMSKALSGHTEIIPSQSSHSNSQERKSARVRERQQSGRRRRQPMNNPLEVYNRTLNEAFLVAHPEVIHFVSGIDEQSRPTS